MANERRLIDASALPVTTLTDGGYWERDVVYKSDVDAAPTVDAVEAVRCKNCVHWNHGDCYRLELPRPDDFCSHGERKTSNAEE